MSERITLKQIAITAISILCLVIAATLSMKLDANTVTLLLKEGGIIETASAAGYFICIGLLYFIGRVRSLKTHWYLYIILLAMALRELDFDKRFTETGVLKSKFLVASDVSIFAKSVGLLIVLLVLTSVFTLVFKHAKSFFKDVIQYRAAAWMAGLSMAFVVLTKSIDGLARKLAPLGIVVTENVNQVAAHFEEIFELAIPMTIMYSIYLYWRTKPSDITVP